MSEGEKPLLSQQNSLVAAFLSQKKTFLLLLSNSLTTGESLARFSKLPGPISLTFGNGFLAPFLSDRDDYSLQISEGRVAKEQKICQKQPFFLVLYVYDRLLNWWRLDFLIS